MRATAGAGRSMWPAPASTIVEVLMQTVLYLDIDPTVLADLLHALTLQGEVLAIRAGQDALALGSAVGLVDETTIRAYLTTCGLTPRQCDLIVLDLQGHSRADIAELCGVSPATVKKYWAAIYARLGVESRPMLRAWLWAQLAIVPVPRLQEQACGVGPLGAGETIRSRQTLAGG
jgi:DNA-binding NarL/FixJ family response regulator